MTPAHHFLVSGLLSSLCLCTTGWTQVEVVGGGCTVPAGGDVPRVTTEEAEVPVLGNLAFHLLLECPESSTAAFILFGGCVDLEKPPLLPESSCGGQCVQIVDSAGLTMQGRPLPTEGPRMVKFDLGIPNLPSLSGTELCVQFLCFDMTGPEPECRAVSQGAKVTFL